MTFYLVQDRHGIEEIQADSLTEAEHIAERDYTYGIVFETETEANQYLDQIWSA